MKVNKIILTPILIVVFTILFILLDWGKITFQLNLIIQPIIFSISATLCILYIHFRKIIIISSLILLTLMVLVYLFNQIELSTWIGTLGFGMFFITVISYLPQLVKKGHLEKF